MAGLRRLSVAWSTARVLQLFEHYTHLHLAREPACHRLICVHNGAYALRIFAFEHVEKKPLEAGQIAVILVLAIVAWALSQINWKQYFNTLAAWGMGSVAAFWTIDRALLLF